MFEIFLLEKAKYSHVYMCVWCMHGDQRMCVLLYHFVFTLESGSLSEAGASPRDPPVPASLSAEVTGAHNHA